MSTFQPISPMAMITSVNALLAPEWKAFGDNWIVEIRSDSVVVWAHGVTDGQRYGQAADANLCPAVVLALEIALDQAKAEDRSRIHDADRVSDAA
jgi:hypothetical protein